MSHDSKLRNQVQLITYPDSLGGNLKSLRKTIKNYFPNAIGGVHILPFYPSNADRGFCPLTHFVVDPKFGTWKDIHAIADEYDLVADLAVNHISNESVYFKDYIEYGEQSKYASMFLDVDAFLLKNGAKEEALQNTYRPRVSDMSTKYVFRDGSTRRLWTTFAVHQVDLNVTTPITKKLLARFIHRLAENGVMLLRLDAVGYSVKKAWTSSFLIPETFEFMHWIRDITPKNIEILAEIHEDYTKQKYLLEQKTTDWVYDFSLPLLTIHALFNGDNSNLKNWISVRPSKCITTLDTHDGIGVVDVAGLMSQEEIDATVNQIMSHGGETLLRGSGSDSDNLYQVNSTYYSALGCDDDSYITARAIQFFLPGIPQVYYVGLLAGENDFETFNKTNVGRDLNRHNYTEKEVVKAMRLGVVQRLLMLMQFRSSHIAFNGTFSLLPSTKEKLILRWDMDDMYAEAQIDLLKKQVEIKYINTTNGNVEMKYF